MEFSERWLREWVNPAINVNSLCDQIVQLGLEIEKITYVSNVCSNLIVGEVIKVLKDYSNIKLLLIKIKIKNNQYIKVISRNFNFIKGMKVIIAVNNSKLFNYNFLKLVQLNKLRCDGIVCFCEDVGLINLDDCAIILPSNSVIEKDVCEYVTLDDNVIKIRSTPNRSDALSILGIARDIAAWNDLPQPRLKKYFNLTRSSSDLNISINIPDTCWRFFGRTIKNINIKRNTPFWMKEKLIRSSLKLSNIVINIINYVLIEIGQPLYIIDLDCILKKIILRKSYKHERFVNSNNEEVFIDDDVIVISDEEKILALGGHINSFDSAIDLNSKNLFLGCSSYYSSNIFERSFNYGCKNIFTERYERGIDFGNQKKALEYATYLILKLCCGEAGKIVKRVEISKVPCKKSIKLYKKKIRNISGFVISDALIVRNLVKLGFKVIFCGEYWDVFAPSWRSDITIEEEVIGELIRMFGYQNVPSIPMSTYFNISREDKVYNALNRAKLLLVDKGYHEIITYGFVDPELQKMFFSNIDPLYISNPISKDMSSMRVSLWMGLLSTVLYNQSRQEHRFRLFESGLCFISDSRENLGVKQVLYFSGLLSGNKNELHWGMSKDKVDFFDLKGDIESIMDLFGQAKFLEFKKHNCLGLCSKASVKIYLKKKIIGFMGIINPMLQKKLRLKNEVMVFELFWGDISFSNNINIRNFSMYPRSFRDISVIVDEEISVGNIIEECKTLFIKNIVDIYLFDIFRGNDIGVGKKSLTFRLVLENREKTFREKDISGILKTCIEVLELKFKTTVRK
ncbi:MAG: phenylalanine--tRNA ligase subunit beta [Buchnera aphidicola (Nurudea shiraii)]